MGIIYKQANPWLSTVAITPIDDNPTTIRAPQENDDDSLIDFKNPTILALVIIAAVLALVTVLVVIYLCYQARKKTTTSTGESDKTIGSRYKMKGGKKAGGLSITKTTDTVNFTQGGGASGGGTQGFVPKGNVKLNDTKNMTKTTNNYDTTVN